MNVIFNFNSNDDIIIIVIILLETYEEKQLMLKLTWVEFFARDIPEAFLFIFAAYAFSKNAINIKKYLLSSVLLAVMVYFIRLLPIQYGVNTILSIIVIIVIIVNINQIDTIKSIKAVVITVILEFICEGINIFIIQSILKLNMNYIFNNAVLKILYGIPSLLLFGCIIAIYYFKLLKRKELKYFTDGEIVQQNSK